jgi:hypothetical protein
MEYQEPSSSVCQAIFDVVTTDTNSQRADRNLINNNTIQHYGNNVERISALQGHAMPSLDYAGFPHLVAVPLLVIYLLFTYYSLALTCLPRIGYSIRWL